MNVFLYVFKLQDCEKIKNFFILHYSSFDYENKQNAILEASIIYDYADFTNVEIIDYYDNYTFFDIDPNVKSFMANYGIENVRGGSYKTKELDEYKKKSLEDEIKTTKTMDDKHLILSNIIKEHIGFNKQELQNHYETLCKSIEKYEKTMKLYNLCSNIEYHNNTEKKQYTLSRDFLDNMKFIERLYYSDKQHILSNDEDYLYYNETLAILKGLSKNFHIIYREYYNNDYIVDDNLTMYIKYPEFLFSHRKQNTKYFSESKEELFIHTMELFDYMILFLINRMDEYEFDMNIISNTNPAKMYLEKKYYEKMITQ